MLPHRSAEVDEVDEEEEVDEDEEGKGVYEELNEVAPPASAGPELAIS